MLIFTKVLSFIFQKLYDLGISFYFIAIYIASIFNKKADLFLQGRKLNVNDSFESSKKRIWVHCSSLGEFEQARTIIDQLKKDGFFIILTFFSPSGFEIRKKYSNADLVCYLPFDFKKNAINFINTIKPDLVIWTKYDFWFNILNEVYIRNIPIILIAAHFRKEQLFFKWYGKWYLSILKVFHTIFVQDETSKKLLNSKNIESTIGGDPRFDRVYSIASLHKNLDIIQQFISHNKSIVFGSTWKKDIEVCKEFIDHKIKDNYKIIIAPHNVNNEEIQFIENSFQNQTLCYSNFNPNNEKPILIIDNVGSLSHIYRYSSWAYVGGGFDHSIHNILEVVAHGKAVVFGPNFKRSREANELLQLKCAFTIFNAKELTEVGNILENTEKINEINQKNNEYISKNIGATKKVIELIRNTFSKPFQHHKS